MNEMQRMNSHSQGMSQTLSPDTWYMTHSQPEGSICGKEVAAGNEQQVGESHFISFIHARVMIQKAVHYIDKKVYIGGWEKAASDLVNGFL